MKECKKRFEKCKERCPHRPPNEIDFGLGWIAALKWMKDKLKCEISPGDIEYFIDKELGNETEKT